MDHASYHFVQLDRPEHGWDALQALATQARSAAEQVDSKETPVRFLRSIFVPDDETCFHLFEGTAAAVAEARGLMAAPAAGHEGKDRA